MRSPLTHRLDPAFLRSELQRIVSKYARRIRRVDRQVVTLEPAGPARGEVLFSYIVDPFLLPGPEAIPYSHTHFWESWTMAQTFVDLGFRVNAIHWTHGRFLPEKSYDLMIDVRMNLERLAPLLPDAALKIAHLDTGHFSFHNPAQEKRLADLEERRGFALKPQKMVAPNRQIEASDLATLLGNEFTRETYEFAGKPLHRIPISVPFEYPWQSGKDFAGPARRRYLWFGSGGLVHKGLDLVLDAFAGLPEHHLTVCGPIRREPDFERAYFDELYRTPNIETLGWIDVGSQDFLELARRTVALIYPSCSEGGGSSVLTCMHAGMIPIITRESSVDVSPQTGVILRDATVEGIRRAIQELSARPPGELEETARQARSFAREHHTKAHFSAGYADFARNLVGAR
ncbi:MAG: glycosyltransferase [Acidobacteriota bacterium]